jgi:dTDP-4-dehydrorhamnose 3,5-epimerase
LTIDFKEFKSNKIHDLIYFTPTVANDLRGNIWTSYKEEFFSKFLPNNLNFKHDKFSQSKQNVLRGIHGDTKSWKLVSCIYGDIYQVVVDLRENSSSYKSWESFNISSSNQGLVLIPPGCGNAYYVNSRKAVYHYKLAYSGKYFDAEDQFSVAWNEKTLGIKWPCKNPILSIRDKEAEHGKN